MLVMIETAVLELIGGLFSLLEKVRILAAFILL